MVVVFVVFSSLFFFIYIFGYVFVLYYFLLGCVRRMGKPPIPLVVIQHRMLVEMVLPILHLWVLNIVDQWLIFLWEKDLRMHKFIQSFSFSLSSRCRYQHCEVNENNTPPMRIGPAGPKALCNACDIKYGFGEMLGSIIMLIHA